jgi:hypothetical protein
MLSTFFGTLGIGRGGFSSRHPRMGHDLPAEIDEVRARQVALGVIGAPAADFKIGD